MAPNFQKVKGFSYLRYTFSRQKCQTIQNAADEKESAPETQETSGVELQGVHSLLSPLNFNNLLNQNKTDHSSNTYQRCGGGNRYRKT
jgi:hypothetical protein